MTNQTPTDERSNDLKTTLTDDGRHVIARNTVSGSGDVHTVSLGTSGEVVACDCKGYQFNQTCYHVDHVQDSPLLLSSARAKASAGQRVATDGGRVETDDESDLPAFEDMADDPHRERCTGCGRTGPKGLGDDDPAILHERDCPRDDRDDETERAACDECGATAETRFESEISHAAGCSQARGVVDPYADDHEEVDTTPL